MADVHELDECGLVHGGPVLAAVPGGGPVTLPPGTYEI